MFAELSSRVCGICSSEHVKGASLLPGAVLMCSARWRTTCYDMVYWSIWQCKWTISEKYGRNAPELLPNEKSYEAALMKRFGDFKNIELKEEWETSF